MLNHDHYPERFVFVNARDLAVMKTKVIGDTAKASSIGVVLCWGWNTAFPGATMPAEVGAAVGPLAAPLFAWGVSWLPAPPQEPGA